jgi:dolichyl-phosphate-mannose-protein mannosyltransferase
MKKALWWVLKWEYFWLCVILITTMAAHLSIVTLTNPPNSLILDEQHYVKDARYILANHQTERPEHPPLAKLFIMTGIASLGDNPWGWRIPSIIAGTIGIVLFYFICRKVKLSLKASNIATFLFGFENFNFLMSGVAMLDVCSLCSWLFL